MKKEILSTLFVLTCFIALSQTKEYSTLIKKADSLFKSKDYLNSGNTYSTAFKSMGWKGYSNDRYNAARSWATALIYDSAFFQLERIVAKANYSDYDQITSDKSLLSLKSDPRWIPLITKVKLNKSESEANLDKKLIKFLDSLVIEDQKWRHYWTRYNNKELKSDTITEKFILRSMRMSDSLNYFHLRRIFQTHGFPNFDLVGPGGSGNFWLMMQHQDTHVQFQEEVLAKMKIEAEKGKASWKDYAYLLDRVKVNTGRPQVYGTQMQLNSTKTSYEPKPLVEPEKINERRKAVGLDTIENYIALMNTMYFGSLKKN